MTQKLMIAGGGTGGHIYPALAIAREYVSKPGHEAVFVGTEYGLEKNIVPKAGFPLEFVAVGGLKGKSFAQTLRNVAKLPLGFIGAWRVISRHRPNAILGVGGYASGPVLLVGALRGYPTMIHEQNAYPGLTNRILAKFVRTVAVAFPAALERFGRKGHVTGNPVRAEFFQTKQRSASPKRRVLVFGGSQGSRILNNAMTGALLFLAHLRDQLDIVHQTGQADHGGVSEAYRASAFAGARVTPYIDAMAAELEAADLVVCRAGAMTIGELAAVGRSAILVPFALATNNHQLENARVLERAGGAVVITEDQLTPERLAKAIGEIVGDPERARRMGDAVKSLSAPEATTKIVALIEEIQRN